MNLFNRFTPAALFLLGISAVDIQATELINVDTTGMALGAITTIPNTGSLGGSFTPVGGPTITSVAGVKSINLTGTATYLVGPPAPASISGAVTARSVEVWALNPAAVGEETMVGWGRRGGPAGTNMSFNYGNNGKWGAVGHWDAPDLGWDPRTTSTTDGTATPPTLNVWHHLVYTYDGSTTRVYSDGVLANTGATGPLNTYEFKADGVTRLPIVIGGQNSNTSPFDPAGMNATMNIARVRVHDVVLTPEQIAAKFQAEGPSIGTPNLASFTASSAIAYSGQPITLSWVVDQFATLSIDQGIGTVTGTSKVVYPSMAGPTVYTLTALKNGITETRTVTVRPPIAPIASLKHRWSFNEDSGTTAVDSISAANATLINSASGTNWARIPVAGGPTTNGAVRLPGGSYTVAPYIDLPNDLVADMNDATIEGWVTINGASTNQKIYDFGSNSRGELNAPGAPGTYTMGAYVTYLNAQVGSIPTGGTTTTRRVDLRGNSSSNISDLTADPLGYGTQFHFAVVYDTNALGIGVTQVRFYKDGALKGSVNATASSAKLGDIKAANGVNMWLGRSSASSHGNFNGDYNEFRIWNGVLSPGMISNSIAAGPDGVPPSAQPEIQAFNVYPSNIVAVGQPTTLSWFVSPGGSGTTTVSIDNGTGVSNSTNLLNHIVVNPTVTTTYTLTATNGTTTRTQAVTVEVRDIGPKATDSALTVPYQGAGSFTFAATDPDQPTSALTYSVLSGPSHGTLSGSGQSRTYTPAAGYFGTDTITWSAFDGFSTSNVGTVTITVSRPPAPVAYALETCTAFDVPLPVTLPATDPDQLASTLTYTIVSGPTNGSLSGTGANRTYTPSAGFSGTDSFTFKVSDGTLESEVASVTITVFPAPVAPTAVTLSGSSLRTDDAVGSLVARLQSTDVNGLDTFSYALVSGAGSTNNGDFTISGNQLISNRDFSSALGQTVSVRIRVTDSGGNSYEQVVSMVVAAADTHIKVNEVYYNSPDNNIQAEYIELYNPFSTAIDLSGWRFDSGVNYIFPNGTTIPALGYLVVAQNPAQLASLFPVTALGPWTGGLSSDGDTIVLRDSNGFKIDEVAYGINAPWPSPANGDGPSLELVNPTVDNDLGGNWRASTAAASTVNFITKGSGGWSYRKGSAGAPPASWQANGFTQDGTWSTGTTPIGLFLINSTTPVATFGEAGVTLATQLTDMASSTTTPNYNSVLFRKTFTISGTVPKALWLRVLRNDAAIVWINGREVGRFGFAPNAPLDPSYNSSQLIYERGNDPWSEHSILNTDEFLVSGTNTISIQGWAKPPVVRSTSPESQDDPALYNVFDFAIDAELRALDIFKGTPGAQNSTFAANPAPAIRNVDHSPEMPNAAEPIVVTARISDRQGLGAVQLKYQIVAPGNYIPAELPLTNAEILANPARTKNPNPAFEDSANWVTINMTDSGTKPDTAGDGTFTAVIPAQPHRTLVRYRVFATDLSGASSRYPAVDDTSRNAALFVYNGVPQWTNNGKVFSTEQMTSLPVYHFITRDADYTRLLAYAGADQFANNNTLAVLEARRFYNFEGAFFYDGKVHDHVEVRLRGGNSRYNGTGKRHFRFKFPKGYALEAKDNKGRPYPRKWEQLLFNKQFGNKGYYDWGLPYTVGATMWKLQGVPTPFHHWVHWRVVRNAQEAASTATGDYWGVYQALELPEGKNFLKSRDLPAGNFYKMSDFIQNGEMDERYQAAGSVDHAEDFDNIRYNIHEYTTQADFEKYINMPLYYKYNAVQEAIRHYDIFIEPTGRHRVKNLYWYFQPQVDNPLGQCWYMPYDWDASFGPNWNNGNDNVIGALYNRMDVPDSPTWGSGAVAPRDAMHIEHRNAVREFRDLIFYRNTSNSRGPVDDIIDDAVTTLGIANDIDRSRWPATGAAADHVDGINFKAQDMKNFCFVGWTDAVGTDPAVGVGGRAAYLDTITDTNNTRLNPTGANEATLIPAKPTLTYTGANGYPLDGLAFTSSNASDPQGAATVTKIQWRLGEVAAPTATTDRIYEADALWFTEEALASPTSIPAKVIPAGLIRVGHSYRARVRHLDATGRASHWSDPIAFTAAQADSVGILAQALVISELMYKPSAATSAELAQGWADADFEYLEITNRSSSLNADLSQVRLTKGVDYDFANGSILSLAPGAKVLVVRNVAAFTSRYGSGLPVTGAWTTGDNLSNGGERVKLSFGAGNAIRDFTYNNASPWPTAPSTSGFSLVYIGSTPTGSPDTVVDPQNTASNWRASYVAGGTPGYSDPITLAEYVSKYTLSGPSGDDDQDGLNNTLEWAFGTEIRAFNPVDTIENISGTDFLTFTYNRRRGLPSTSFVGEVSTDLVAWSGAAVQELSVIDNGDGTEQVKLQITTPTDSRQRCYVHVTVVAP